MLRWNACNCQIESQIKVSTLGRPSFGTERNEVNMRPINSSLHKRSLCVMKHNRTKYFSFFFFSFRAQFKVNPDNVLRSHSSTLCFFSVFVRDARWWARKRERKLKFQIVYNYFSINCHTLHTKQLAIFSLLIFWVMEKIFFSTSISVFGFLVVFVFRFSEWKN